MAASSRLRATVGSAIEAIRRKRVVSLAPEGGQKGNVLLSYITKPFTLKPDDRWWGVHSNMWECKEIATTWLEAGYAVDVIDYRDSNFVPRKKYDVLIDIHDNLERLAPLVGKDCLKILHATGSHWRFQNEAEQRRLNALRERRHVVLQARRTVPPSRGPETADFVTLLGNDATESTFAYAGKPIYKLKVSSPVAYPWDDGKDFESCGKRFLWLGGSGLVLKGLDIVLEAFAGMPELQLTVCGPTDKERDFADAYHKELFETKNIRTIGWVDQHGDQFRQILHETGALVYPSASEGQSTSVVVCLHAGLVPVVSAQSGVDVPGFGRVLTECSVDEVRREARAVAGLNPKDFETMSRSAWEYARQNHTRESFSREYRKVVSDILGRARPS